MLPLHQFLYIVQVTSNKLRSRVLVFSAHFLRLYLSRYSTYAWAYCKCTCITVNKKARFTIFSRAFVMEYEYIEINKLKEILDLAIITSIQMQLADKCTS